MKLFARSNASWNGNTLKTPLLVNQEPSSHHSFMLKQFRHRNIYLILTFDILLVVFSLYLAYAIRFDFVIPASHFQMFFHLLPGVLIIKFLTFFVFHLYQGMWRYTSLEDVIDIVKASSVSTVIIIIGLLMLYRFQSYSRSIFLIDWGLTIIFLCGIRLSIRVVLDPNLGIRFIPFLRKKPLHHKRLLIIGAGDTGEKVVRDVLNGPELHFTPVGFLDDDHTKHGKTIHGIKVLGGIAQLDSFLPLFDEMLIALPSEASDREMRRIVAMCEKTEKPFQTMPAMGKLLDGTYSLQVIRNITLQELLNREEISLDEKSIRRYLEQKRVLVTGAGGSIGSELVQQIRKFRPAALALVDISEFNLFQIMMECCPQQEETSVTSVLADIREQQSVSRIFQQFQPHVVFHAAAYKHVPLQEGHPWEAVRNNILGTNNLVQAAVDFHVGKFVLVSSDKAVRPTSVMGATKRVAEQMIACANHPQNHCQFMAVRFGNVLGSSGSVIPIFQDQIARGGPVTVTHPDVIRYFMSIPEAAQLILQAGALGRGGEIFVLDMGKPVRIDDLAKDLIRLHGYEPGNDIEIRYTGLRPGEKLYEELFRKEEILLETGHKHIMVFQDMRKNWKTLQAQIDSLVEAARMFDGLKIKQKLREMVPEYVPFMDDMHT